MDVESKPLNFAVDSKIDRNRLDDECATWPELLMRYCEATQDAQKTLDEAKLHVEITKAQMSNEIRNDPKLFNLPDNPNETAIRNAVMLTAEYRRALQERNTAQRNKDFMVVAIKAIERKGKSLETLTKLHGQAYLGTLGDGTAEKASRRGAERARQEREAALQEDVKHDAP